MGKGKPRDYQAMAVDYGTSNIHQVLQHGTNEEISTIIQHKINPDCISEDGNTVVTAILKNEKLMENDVFKFLLHFLRRDVDPNFKDAHGEAALHLAIRKRMVAVVNLLLSFDADVDIADNHKNSIVHFFIEVEYENCKETMLCPLMNTPKKRKIAEKCTISFLKFLISKRVRFQVSNHDGLYPLHLAIERNLPYILPILLNYSLPNVAGDNSNFKIVSAAIKEKKDMRIIKEIINFYLKKCDKKAATSLFFELIDTCRSWSESESDYFLTILRKLITRGAGLNDELSREELVFTAIDAKNSHLLELFSENMDFENGGKLLHYLADCLENDTSINFCKYFIRNVCDVNAKDESKKTALHVAVNSNNMLMAQLLIEIGADINCVDNHLSTPLHEALRTITSFQLIKLLLKSGADPNAQDDEDTAPLHLAVKKNDLSVVQLLLDFGAFANSRDGSQRTPLHNMTKYISREMIELLLVNGADVNATDSWGWSLLHVTISHNNASVARTLIKYGASVDCRDRYQQTPLHLVSVPKKPLGVVELLVESGADVNAKDHEGKTPLYLAVTYINLSSVLSLIQHGGSIDCKTNSRQTLLHAAVAADYEGKIVELLLTSGVDVNAPDAEGNRPIHQVFERRYVDDNREFIMKMLLSNGAYVNARNNRGESALFFALSRNEPGMVNELLEYSADPNDSHVRRLSIECDNEFLYYTDSSTKQLLLPHILLLHLVKLEAANLPFEQDYKTRYKYDSYLQEYYTACLNEVEKLKNISVGNKKSLFDFLHMSPRTRAAFYINRKELQNLIGLPDLKKQFPIYGVVILASYHDSVIKKPLLEPAKKSLYELISVILPENVDSILDYLNEVDLANIIEANAI